MMTEVHDMFGELRAALKRITALENTLAPSSGHKEPAEPEYGTREWAMAQTDVVYHKTTPDFAGIGSQIVGLNRHRGERFDTGWSLYEPDEPKYGIGKFTSYGPPEPAEPQRTVNNPTMTAYEKSKQPAEPDHFATFGKLPAEPAIGSLNSETHAPKELTEPREYLCASGHTEWKADCPDCLPDLPGFIGSYVGTGPNDLTPISINGIAGKEFFGHEVNGRWTPYTAEDFAQQLFDARQELVKLEERCENMESSWEACQEIWRGQTKKKNERH
jgi:hypothetical protein